jgi:COP9 signalosome complex subunit 2
VLLARLHQLASLYRQHAAVCCFAADEELEEQDVDIENQYYNSKGLLESEEWGEALAGFRQVIKMEGGEKGEW